MPAAASTIQLCFVVVVVVRKLAISASGSGVSCANLYVHNVNQSQENCSQSAKVITQGRREYRGIKVLLHVL